MMNKKSQLSCVVVVVVVINLNYVRCISEEGFSDVPPSSTFQLLSTPHSSPQLSKSGICPTNLIFQGF